MNTHRAQKENSYQAQLKKRIKERFKHAIVAKMNPNDIQGIPDLVVLFKNHWALLETKRDPQASKRPNQDFYVDFYNNWSFAAFINPENEEEVLNAMEQSFSAP